MCWFCLSLLQTQSYFNFETRFVEWELSFSSSELFRSSFATLLHWTQVPLTGDLIKGFAHLNGAVVAHCLAGTCAGNKESSGSSTSEAAQTYSSTSISNCSIDTNQPSPPASCSRQTNFCSIKFSAAGQINWLIWFIVVFCLTHFLVSKGVI